MDPAKSRDSGDARARPTNSNFITGNSGNGNSRIARNSNNFPTDQGHLPSYQEAISPTNTFSQPDSGLDPSNAQAPNSDPMRDSSATRDPSALALMLMHGFRREREQERHHDIELQDRQREQERHRDIELQDRRDERQRRQDSRRQCHKREKMCFLFACLLVMVAGGTVAAVFGTRYMMSQQQASTGSSTSD